jgi:hypothetical protein
MLRKRSDSLTIISERDSDDTVRESGPKTIDLARDCAQNFLLVIGLNHRTNKQGLSFKQRTSGSRFLGYMAMEAILMMLLISILPGFDRKDGLQIILCAQRMDQLTKELTAKKGID